MHVRLGVVRDVVVQDVRDPVDVETARSHVGGHEDVDLTVLQLRDGALTLRLGDVAVDGSCREPARPQPLRQVFGGLLGAYEHDHRVELLDFEDTGQRVQFALVRDLEIPLRDVRRGPGLGLHRDLDRVLEVLLRQPADRLGHGGREQRHLLGLRRIAQDALDVFGKTHVQHLVGLVEDEVVQLGDVEGALVEVVDDTARRSDDDLCATAETRQLHGVALTAVDREHLHTWQMCGVAAERLGHLQREFTRRSQDECLRLTRR